jgi:hypothetical protein
MFMVLMAVSVVLSLICASVDMFAPELDHPHPLIDHLLPKVVAGDFERALPAKKPLGVDGPMSLLPLILAWAIVGWPLARIVVLAEDPIRADVGRPIG